MNAKVHKAAMPHSIKSDGIVLVSDGLYIINVSIDPREFCVQSEYGF